MFKGGPSVASHDFVQSVGQKQFVKEDASEFQNFHVEFRKFLALFFTRLSQSGRLSQALRNMASAFAMNLSVTTQSNR
jgi:hypothetical protein